MRVAVVDIGSNSTRLLVADVAPAEGVDERVRESAVTRLAEGVESGGRLGDAAQERVLAVLERYAATIREQGCERSTAVMTSAVRDAANGAAFATAVRDRTGLAGRTLSGEEEAALTFAGATAARPGGGNGLLVIDIGGGSTELVCGDGFHVSLQLGVVRHGERHLRHDPPQAGELDALRADVRVLVRAAVPDAVRAGVREAVAVAGTATTCASIELELEPYDSAAVEGRLLSATGLDALLGRLAALPTVERAAVRGLHPDRSPVIVPGIVILLEALAAFGLDAVEVSDRDILHGAARALAFG